MKIKLQIVIACLLLMYSITISAQTPYLVKDINPNSPWSSPKLLTKVGQNVFFEAITNAGWGLYKSDGTTSGTVLLKNYGPNYELYNLTDINGVLYFRANDGVNGYELWTSDGTAAGTVMVKDINPGSLNSYPGDFIYFNNQIFFVASDNVNGPAIWTTDGTAAGTVVFKDLTPGSTSGGGAYSFTIMNNAFYFWANPVAQTNIELWKSDGTNTGTTLVKAFSGFTTPSIKVSNNKLFFAYGGGTTGSQGIWVSDGSNSGTILLKALNVSIAMGVLEDEMIDVNGTLFFRGDDGINGKELWKSDGTPLGTAIVKNIRSGNIGSGPDFLTSYNGKCYFVAVDDNSTTELWKSDGSDSGTVQIEAQYSGCTHPTSLYVHNNILFFNASPWTGNTGTELWKSDGTTTSIVYDIYPGSNSSSIMYLTGVNNKLYFQAEDNAHGKELWALDVNNTSGISENTNTNQLLIYPNPAIDFVTISNIPSGSTVNILDITGKVVYSSIKTNEQTITINTNDFTNGIYIIRTVNNGNSANRKFIINK